MLYNFCQKLNLLGMSLRAGCTIRASLDKNDTFLLFVKVLDEEKISSNSSHLRYVRPFMTLLGFFFCVFSKGRTQNHSIEHVWLLSITRNLYTRGDREKHINTVLGSNPARSLSKQASTHFAIASPQFKWEESY